MKAAQLGARRLFRWYALSGTKHLSKEDRSAVIFFAVVGPVAIFAFLSWALYYLLLDAMTFWPAAAACAGMSIGLVIPAIAKRNRIAAEISFTILASTVFSTLVYMFGADSGLNLGLLASAFLLTMECGTRRPVIFALTVGPQLVLFGALPVWFAAPQLFTSASPELLNTIYMSNAASLVGVILVSILIILRRAELAEAALSSEFERSETLLANLLPPAIAARLKQSPGQIIADEVASATFLFADIVGFTPRAANMKAEALIGFLNSVFSVFDDLTAKHGLEKIKTIGDAYMVAGGLPVARADHAHAVANLALDMQSAVARLSKETGDRVEIRIGLHTGPAIAGVIGSKKVFYDAWGDTVNTAARMESHSVPGRIQITAETRTALGDSFSVAPRGVIDIKGKGLTETFWLLERATKGLPPL